MTVEEPARLSDAPLMQSALEHTVSDRPRTYWAFSCPDCTWASVCPDCERRIDAWDYERLYGDPDDWDPDR